MPLKKHKKNMRTYENCFSSTDAVDWLQKSLQKNPNFGAEVTKEQTVLLLQKLYRAGIIENVREDSNDEEFKVNIFYFKSIFSFLSLARKHNMIKNYKVSVNINKSTILFTVQVSGELYRFSNKSPVRNLRTPGKMDRKPLSDTGNTPHAPRSKERDKENVAEKPEREKSSSRKIKEEMKKQLNLSYFQVMEAFLA